MSYIVNGDAMTANFFLGYAKIGDDQQKYGVTSDNRTECIGSVS